MIKGEERDWFEAAGYQVKEARMRGHFYFNDQGANPYTYPDWVIAMNGEVYSGNEGSSDVQRYSFHFADTSVLLINASIPLPIKIYRADNFSFVSQPQGLAGQLMATQNFLPYEGELGIAEEDLGVTRYRGKVINLNGALTEHQSMKALVQAVDLDIMSGRSSISLGVPSRLSYQNLVN